MLSVWLLEQMGGIGMEARPCWETGPAPDEQEIHPSTSNALDRWIELTPAAIVRVVTRLKSGGLWSLLTELQKLIRHDQARL